MKIKTVLDNISFILGIPLMMIPALWIWSDFISGRDIDKFPVLLSLIGFIMVVDSFIKKYGIKK